MKNVKIINERFKNIESHKNYRYIIICLLKLFSFIIIMLILLFSPTKSKKYINFPYFACFCSVARLENLYVRDLMSYYMGIGFKKFIFGDNNLPNKEKLSDIIKDYINNGTADIIDIFGSSISQAEFFQNIYEKYKTKCAWISFFDFDEYLRIYPGDNKTTSINEYLSNPVFDKCESIGINWLIYSDNNLLFYDNRTVLERFTSPSYNDVDNKFVKSIIRGNLNKKLFSPGTSSHVPEKRVIICNSEGKRLKYHDRFSVKPPLFKNAYLMHYNTKTVEEYIKKIRRGGNMNAIFDVDERIERFFSHNNFTEEKLKMFESAFNKTFFKFHKQNIGFNILMNLNSFFLILFFLYL